MKRTRLIIGVLGGSRKVPSPVVDLAIQVGRAVATADVILLTGGIGGEKKVKDAAVDGAMGGRIISIIKDGCGVRFRTARHILIESGIGDARNVLNGFTPDVLIALWGGSGTLTEVAFAAIAGRPVVFLNSRTDLARHVEQMGTIAARAVDTFRNEGFSDEHLRRAVRPLLDNPKTEVTTVTAAIESALRAPMTGMLPEIPCLSDAVSDYQRLLEDLQK